MAGIRDVDLGVWNIACAGQHARHEEGRIIASSQHQSLARAADAFVGEAHHAQLQSLQLLGTGRG
jgi:hypothetical protein